MGLEGRYGLAQRSYERAHVYVHRARVLNTYAYGGLRMPVSLPSIFDTFLVNSALKGVLLENEPFLRPKTLKIAVLLVLAHMSLSLAWF